MASQTPLPLATARVCHGVRNATSASHIRDSLFDGIGVATRFLGRRGREREVIGIGRDQHAGEGLAGLAERRPDQRVVVPGRTLDDGIEPGHVLGRAQHLLLIGLLDGSLYGA